MTADNADGEVTSPEDVRRFFDRIDRDERASLRLAPSLERSALNALGAHQNLIERVRWIRFHQAGPGGTEVSGDPAKAMRLIAEGAHIAWPHDEFATVYASSNKVRQRIAHMVWIESIDGAAPNRTLNMMVAGDRTWVDGTTSKQSFRRESLTERQIGEALAGYAKLLAYVHALDRIINIFEQFPDLPDDHELTRDHLPLPWWLSKWGKPAEKIRVDLLRTDRPIPPAGSEATSRSLLRWCRVRLASAMRSVRPRAN